MSNVWYVGWCVLFLKRSKDLHFDQDEEDSFEAGLLCRFVLDGQGRKIGESIAVFDDLLIIKSGKEFLGVPLKHIEEESIGILVKGLIDQTKALELGAKWQKKNYKEIVYAKDKEDE